jgi:hypothetical protein
MSDFHLGNLPPQPYDAALVERCRLADLARRPFVLKPFKSPEPEPAYAGLRPTAKAKAFLADVLADGAAVLTVTVQAKAKVAGIKPRTLRRAMEDAGVIAKKTAAGWTSQLPVKTAKTD